MSDLLESMVVQADKQEYVRNIITSSNHMQSIVNDVLDIAQLSEHELRLNYQPMNLRQLLEAEGKLMKRAVEGKEWKHFKYCKHEVCAINDISYLSNSQKKEVK
jgi:two-component system sensor histidine kinase BarA